jgi:UDP-N-acetylglucosamine 2-epimerase (non-hydrolysing)
MNKVKVVTIVGTRPELIKLSRIIALLDKNVDHYLIHTGQNHDYELNEIFFKDLKIRNPNHYLNCVGKDAVHTISNIIKKTYDILKKIKPDCILIYGDTNSCLSSFSAKKLKIPIFHMEAGNRSFDENIPEEINRRIIDHISDVNMVITEHARRYLSNEGIPQDRVFCTGSNMIEVLSHYKKSINSSSILKKLNLAKSNYFVLSIHREENVDNIRNLKDMVQTINEIAKTFKKKIILSNHPRTKERLIKNNLKLHKNINVLKPLGFFDYIKLQQNAYCVISDSGTITEESSILNFPAITIRKSHERPEGFDEGILIMSGLKYKRVIESIKVTRNLLSKKNKIDHKENLVSKKVLKIILSYTDKIKRDVWKIED